MKPDSYYKINGKKLPVYKTPLEKEVLNQILLNDIGVFLINDNGKIKPYNTRGNLPKQFSLFEDFPTITFQTILKLSFVSVLALWVYRLGTFRPNLNPFKVDKEHLKNLEKKYRDLNKLKYRGRGKSPIGENKEAEDKTSASLPNGWEIKRANLD